MDKIFALEYTGHFLREQRTELYPEYSEGVAEPKNGLGAKSDLEGRTCFGLERRGA